MPTPGRRSRPAGPKSQKFNHEKFTQPASAIELVGTWDPKTQTVIPFTEEELEDRRRRRDSRLKKQQKPSGASKTT